MSSVLHSSSSAQKGSIWRKLEKEVEIFLIFALMFLRFKKAISYHLTGALPNGEGIGIFEPDFEEGVEMQFMLRNTAEMIESAKRNSSELMEQIKTDGRKALFGMYIDCAGRTAKYLNTKIEEASEVQAVFNHHNTPLFGFYSRVICPSL
ncbi:MAG TPA: FIST C-terminal domain-containing protein [Desulfatiglandales bacterium]|nr:FIST C-terminal domain-containing protein [Desulfatiglandales bacterium]